MTLDIENVLYSVKHLFLITALKSMAFTALKSMALKRILSNGYKF